MANIAGFPYYRAEFDKDGKPVDPAQLDALVAAAAPAGGLTDLFVISHGWNNDMKEAQTLYEGMFRQFRAMVTAGTVPGLANRKFAVAGIFWPSKKFADESVIPGGAASLGAAASAGPRAGLPKGVLEKQLDALKGVFDNPKADKLIASAKKLVPDLEDDPKAQKEFADIIRELPGDIKGTKDDASDRFFTEPGPDLLKKLSAPVLAAPRPGRGGGAAGGVGAGPGQAPVGGAAGIGDLFSGIKAGALNLLNLATYYQMKARAGTVGAGPVNALLGKIREKNAGLKIHLLGHSFGGRLVTAAASGPAKFGPSSMTLLQAAFSHNGFSADYDGKKSKGFFRKVVDEQRIDGPILITHSDKDKAVGMAYPLASRINGEQAAGLGDASDKFGGIGRNGAVHTAEAVKGVLAAPGTKYTFEKGKLYNLNADGCIQDHSDICKPEVAWAVLTVVAKA